MNRLRMWWGAALSWLVSWATTAASKRIADAIIRDLKTGLRTARRDSRQRSELVDALQNEVAELRQNVLERDHQIGQLENKLDLTESALQFQLMWREKEVERMRAEAAIQTRRRVEAIANESPTLSPLEE